MLLICEFPANIFLSLKERPSRALIPLLVAAPVSLRGRTGADFPAKNY